jgi:hypothetical protein
MEEEGRQEERGRKARRKSEEGKTE